MRIHNDSGKKESPGLRPLNLWQAKCYPFVLAVVGLYTWSKDQILARLLARRRFDNFVFMPDTFANAHLSTPMRVLVVDDSDIHQEISLRLLNRSGSIADFARNGFEAIEACRRNHYDLVLMDLVKPGMPGSDATKEIRRESSSKHVRIIAVSEQLPVSAEILREYGVDGYLTKPLNVGDLQRQLRVSSALRHKAE